MAIITCDLYHAIHLVIQPEILANSRKSYPHIALQSHQQVKDWLNHLSRFGIGIVIETDKQGERIIFCTPSLELCASLTKRNRDGFFVFNIRPISLHRYRDLSQNAVKVFATRWLVHSELWAINSPVHGGEVDPRSGYEAISRAWQLATKTSSSPTQETIKGLSPKQRAYLERLEEIIDLEEQLDLDEAAEQEQVYYTAVSPVAAPRISGEEYDFQLDGPPPFRKKEYVRLSAAETNQMGSVFAGVVVAIGAQNARIRFRQQLDRTKLPNQGVIQKWASKKPYDIQRDAVRALRQGEAGNPHLLPVIVERKFAPFPSVRVEKSVFDLNPAQATVLSRAARCEDMLLVLGPPGTGKTKTIRAVVERQAKDGKRTLITSQNNKAVDNVLEGLVSNEPDGERPFILRIGRPDAVSTAIQPLLIDEKAQELQRFVLKKLQPQYQALSKLLHDWDQVEEQLKQTNALALKWRQSISQNKQAIDERQKWLEQAYANVQADLNQQRQLIQDARHSVELAADSAERWSQVVNLLGKSQHWPLVGGVGVLLVNLAYGRWQHAAATYRKSERQFWRSVSSYKRSEQTYINSVLADPQTKVLQTAYNQIKSRCRQLEEETRKATEETAVHFQQAGLDDIIPSPSVGTPEAIIRFATQAHQIKPIIKVRQRLLTEWKQLLAERYQALYPSLVRRANVIGATCIGIGTDVRFDDLDFDLVIADEAGQIQATDVIVPLARARRAILVGDHKQLPPLVKEPLKKILAREDDSLEIVSKSLFETLFPLAPQANKVSLEVQYRMPAVIANFIRDQFYEGRYATDKQLVGRDAIFSEAFVFIDTKNEPQYLRQDKVNRQAVGEAGYTNELEAKTLARLFLAYCVRGVNQGEVGVIVPYKAQAELIRSKIIAQSTGFTAQSLEEIVSTVDSFQGKEKDIILFGFTRSNNGGRIGFMRETRRLNVSLTRAKRQLVVIGDSVTLQRADDEVFARICRNLVDYVKQKGEYLTYRDLNSKL